MAYFKHVALLAIALVLLPLSGKAFEHDHHDDLAPAFAPFLEKVCDEVECGRGKCIGDIKYPFGFKCECEPDWKRTRGDDNDDDHLGFLPCVIPNCTMDYSCQPAPPPVPEKEVPFNKSFFDPCYWTYCGEGTCTKNSTYKHRCECKPGFYNLMNISFYPCYNNCTVGSDCSRLGIKVINAVGSDVNDTSDDSNGANSFIPGKSHWVAVLLALAFWQQG